MVGLCVRSLGTFLTVLKFRRIAVQNAKVEVKLFFYPVRSKFSYGNVMVVRMHYFGFGSLKTTEKGENSTRFCEQSKNIESFRVNEVSCQIFLSVKNLPGAV